MKLDKIGYLIAKYGDVSPKKTKAGIIYWSARINGSQIKQQSKNWTTFKQAKQNYYNYLNSIDVAEVEGFVTFEYVANEYLNYIQLVNKGSSYLKEKTTINAHLMPYFNTTNVREINLKKITNFQRLILKKTYHRDGIDHLYKNRTLEIIQECLRAILSFAVKHEYINSNPFNFTVIIKRNSIEPTARMTILTITQFNQFTSYLTDQLDVAMYSILFWCGLRFGEMMALNIGDYNVSDKTLNIYKNYDPKNKRLTTTKTNQNRTVSVPDQCIIELDKLLIDYNKSIPTLRDDFPLIGLNQRISHSIKTKEKLIMLEKINKEEEIIPYFTFHELRHSHVSILLELGLSPHEISKRLGHSVEMVNETYGHLFPKKNKQILDMLNSLNT